MFLEMLVFAYIPWINFFKRKKMSEKNRYHYSMPSVMKNPKLICVLSDIKQQIYGLYIHSLATCISLVRGFAFVTRLYMHGVTALFCYLMVLSDVWRILYHSSTTVLQGPLTMLASFRGQRYCNKDTKKRVACVPGWRLLPGRHFGPGGERGSRPSRSHGIRTPRTRHAAPAKGCQPIRRFPPIARPIRCVLPIAQPIRRGLHAAANRKPSMHGCIRQRILREFVWNHLSEKRLQKHWRQVHKQF